MDSPTAAVIIASVQSVAKVYVIGAVGFFSVKYPRGAPILPYKAISAVARFTFHALLVPLVFSTTASSVTPETLQDYWFVVVAAFVVMLLSYFAATILQPCFRINQRDFYALRISATYPNIVALPILIFPSLCEYAVVQDGYSFGGGQVEEDVDPYLHCVSVSNTMIFCYFFSWSLAFWALGYPQLLRLTNLEQPSSAPPPPPPSLSTDANSDATTASDSGRRNKNNNNSMHDGDDGDVGLTIDDSNPSETGSVDKSFTVSSSAPKESVWKALSKHIYRTVKQVLKAPPFWAMALGIATGCIEPLKDALFSPGGALRFLGGALESLGQASSPISTIVVAASLVPQPDQTNDDDDDDDDDDNHAAYNDTDDNQHVPLVVVPEESPMMSDPNIGPNQLRRRSSIMRFQQSLKTSSRVLLGRSDPELRKQLIWFSIARLLLAPALVTALLVAMDCGGWTTNVPGLAKVVVIVNACVPGALVIVVLLKQREELADTAAVVARVYLPTYLISIVTIAGWTALGLWLTLPDENGDLFCSRSG